MSIANSVIYKKNRDYINAADSALSTAYIAADAVVTAAYTAADLTMVKTHLDLEQDTDWTIPEGQSGMVVLTAAASAGDLVLPTVEDGAILYIKNADDADTTSVVIAAGKTAQFIGIDGAWVKLLETT